MKSPSPCVVDAPVPDSLVRVLKEMADLLRGTPESRWARQLGDCRSAIWSGRVNGIPRLLSLFGGMGSLNDLALSDPVRQARFEALKGRAYALATQGGVAKPR